jgi:hypothetical protein
METLLTQLLEMHAEVMRCDEWSTEWARKVDAMSRVLDEVAHEFGHACLLDVMCRFSERTGDGIHIDAAQLQRLVDTGVVILG